MRTSEGPVQLPGFACAGIFADSGAPGYIVIALLAFCLGVLITVFCIRLNRYMNEEDKHDDRDQ